MLKVESTELGCGLDGACKRNRGIADDSISRKDVHNH